MKYTPYYTNRIKRQLKALKKRGYDMNLFKEVVDMLLDGKLLPPRYNDHPLKGNRRGYRDCHILPDWVLIYKLEKDILTLTLFETGTHSDIFE
ncbi:MAG: type II toxin-antitoxin system YafQ family toxin [Defluviitaleaceae bacterium]|nr:type II toxin-antitoxin system YafQ family toxin [Defluviitaleaceae bacterium]